MFFTHNKEKPNIAGIKGSGFPPFEINEYLKCSGSYSLCITIFVFILTPFPWFFFKFLITKGPMEGALYKLVCSFPSLPSKIVLKVDHQAQYFVNVLVYFWIYFLGFGFLYPCVKISSYSFPREMSALCDFMCCQEWPLTVFLRYLMF